MTKSNMKITIIVDGIEREYRGDYYELHNKDWSGIIRDFIDDTHEREEKGV